MRQGYIAFIHTLSSRGEPGGGVLDQLKLSDTSGGKRERERVSVDRSRFYFSSPAKPR